jgi:hypothetical protein
MPSPASRCGRHVQPADRARQGMAVDDDQAAVRPEVEADVHARRLREELLLRHRIRAQETHPEDGSLGRQQPMREARSDSGVARQCLGDVGRELLERHHLCVGGQDLGDDALGVGPTAQRVPRRHGEHVAIARGAWQRDPLRAETHHRDQRKEDEAGAKDPVPEQDGGRSESDCRQAQVRQEDRGQRQQAGLRCEHHRRQRDQHHADRVHAQHGAERARQPGARRAPVLNHSASMARSTAASAG